MKEERNEERRGNFVVMICHSFCECVLYCIVYIHLYSASCSAHQSEALTVRETQREESECSGKRPHASQIMLAEVFAPNAA